MSGAEKRANTKLLPTGAGWNFHTLPGLSHVGLGLEPATSWHPAIMSGSQQQSMRHTKGISHQHGAHGGQGMSQRVGLPPARPLLPEWGFSTSAMYLPPCTHSLGSILQSPQRQVSSSHSWTASLRWGRLSSFPQARNH